MSALRTSARWVGSVILRGRYALLLGWAIGWAHFQHARAGKINDWLIFEYSARVLVIGGQHYPGGLHLYAQNPDVQIGPPPLWTDRGLQWLNPRHAELAGMGLMLLLGLFAIFLAERTAINLGVEPMRVRWQTLIGGLVVLAGWGPLVGLYHHLDDAMALAALAAAAFLCSRVRPSWWGIALLVGFAAACKPWAIVALPLIGVAPRARRSHAFLLVLAQVAAWWAPFEIADPSTSTEVSRYQLLVSKSAVLNQLGLLPERSPSWERPVQLGLAILLGALAVRSGRWACVLFLTLLTRVTLDPQTFTYYAAGPLLGALVVDLCRGRGRVPWVTAMTATLIYVGPWALHGVVHGVLALVGAGVLAVAAYLSATPDPDVPRTMTTSDVPAQRVPLRRTDQPTAVVGATS